ncbi:MAG: hypothetical protein ABIY52_08280 [Gemmatimonadaceae bacterium]
MLTLTFLAIAVLALLAHRSGGRSGPDRERLATLLDSGAIVALVFAVTFVVLWYSWAAVNPVPVVHDEMAYVLQSQIFARGAWSLPSPPLPLFWEQPHVLVEPSLTSKYFPGHSLVMTPGALLGWPALMPLLLQSSIATFLYVLARRIANGGVALLAWVAWLFSPMVLYFGAAFYSEGTTTACWLAGWYALLEWRRTRSAGWLLAVAAFTGWDAITRPLTGLAYAIPVAVIVLRDVVTLRAWRQLAMAFAVGTAVVGILPLWSAKTTGNWRLTPQTLYTREYMPYDVPGFGIDSTAPTHSITPELVQLNNVYSAYHRTHTPAHLPRELYDRLRDLGISAWDSWSGILGIFALLGLLALGAESAFALASCVVLILAYLLYATPPQWTLYYYETVPTLAFLSATGMAWAASQLGRPRGAPNAAALGWHSPRWTRALAATAGVLVLPGLLAMQTLHRQHISDRRAVAQFAGLMSSIHDPKAILFVRYSGMHNPHVAFVRNSANLERERVWVVYDRGEVENARLLSLAPGRKAYLFDEQHGQTFVYDPP